MIVKDVTHEVGTMCDFFQNNKTYRAKITKESVLLRLSLARMLT